MANKEPGHWSDVIPPEERALYQKAGFSHTESWGTRPALLVIDVTYDFVGDVPEPVEKSVERWPLSCGERGWESVGQIKSLLGAAREVGIPVIYTTAAMGETSYDRGRWADKSEAMVKAAQIGSFGAQIVADIAPTADEMVINKKKPSAFFGTPLTSYLIDLGVDTLLISGCTTSGCVRASVIDGFSYNYRIVLPEECCFDRVRLSHAVNLFDMQGKYADVVPLSRVQAYLADLAARVLA